MQEALRRISPGLETDVVSAPGRLAIGGNCAHPEVPSILEFYKWPLIQNEEAANDSFGRKMLLYIWDNKPTPEKIDEQ